MLYTRDMHASIADAYYNQVRPLSHLDQKVVKYCPLGWQKDLAILEDDTIVIHENILSRITEITHDSLHEGKDILDIDEDEWRVLFSNFLYKRRYMTQSSQHIMAYYTKLSDNALNKYFLGKATPSLYNATLLATSICAALSEFYIDTLYPTDIDTFVMSLDYSVDDVNCLYPDIADRATHWYPINNDGLYIYCGSDKSRWVFNRFTSEMIELYQQEDDPDPYGHYCGYWKKPIVYISPTMWAERFSSILKEKLYQSELTQNEICDMIGVSRQMMLRYRRGNAIPSLYIASKLTRALECSLMDFYIL